MKLRVRLTQADDCYGRLRRLILTGQLTEGSRLVEEKWANCLGVSRSAIREAVVLLVHEGLLESGVRGGVFIPRRDQMAYDEILEVRLALEIGSLWAMELRGGVTAEKLRPLRRTCHVMEQLIEAGFEFGFVEADWRFHEQLVELSANKRMLRTFRQAPLPIVSSPEYDDVQRRERMKKTLSEHMLLCDLLESGRRDDAILLLRAHLLADYQTPRTGIESKVEPLAKQGDVAADRQP